MVAAAVVFPNGVPAALARLIDDSKALSREARFAAFQALRAFAPIEIAVGAASVREIAALNILGATMLAMRRAVARLPDPPNFALIDGISLPALPCPGAAIVGGDHTSLSIAAASIIAKVIRDRAMARLAARFPGYGWADNAGYPTARHRDAIRRLGPTIHHRMGFGILRLV